jgi:CheY-like chemotaxis protein
VSIRILLVEDNAMNRDLAVVVLEMDGHAIDVAASGAQLRELLATVETPAIILMDILLPDCDGYELLREIRRIERLANVPVVALTAQALRGDEARMLEAGFAAVITKPIATRTFAAQVASLAAGTAPAAGSR